MSSQDVPPGEKAGQSLSHSHGGAARAHLHSGHFSRWSACPFSFSDSLRLLRKLLYQLERDFPGEGVLAVSGWGLQACPARGGLGRGLVCPLPGPGTVWPSVRAPPDLAQPAPL